MPITPIECNVSLAHFRAWMDRYLAINGNVYVNQSKSQKYIIRYSPAAQTTTREVWNFMPIIPVIDGKMAGNNQWATILAVEVSPNKSQVEFLDGLYYHHDTRLYTVGTDGKESRILPRFGSLTELDRGELIGDDFSRLAEEIKMEWGKGDKKATESEVEITHPIHTRISPVEYAGSVAHFRARMDRFLAINGKTFKVKKEAHTLEYHIGYFTPAQTTTREVWNVYMDPGIVIDGKSPGKSHFGMILAVEDQPDRTIIEFIDGQHYERTTYPVPRSSLEPPIFGDAYLASHKPIGDDFIEIVERIKKGIVENIRYNSDSASQKLLWEQIPNIGWNREAVKLWREGYTTAEIGKRVRKDEQTVRNKIAELRKIHGEEIVPFRRK